MAESILVWLCIRHSYEGFRGEDCQNVECATLDQHHLAVAMSSTAPAASELTGSDQARTG